MAVFIHPWEMMGESDMKKYWLPWLVGMPAETARAACSLIFGGVLERLPRLRVCLAHAGGSLVPTIGRIEHGFNCRPDLVAVDNPVTPRHYRNKIGYDFPLGDLEIGAFIEKMELPADTVERIFYKNTIAWLYGH